MTGKSMMGVKWRCHLTEEGDGSGMASRSSSGFFLRVGGALAPFDNLLKMTDIFPAEMPRSYSFTYYAKSLNAGWLAGPATVKAGLAGERDTGQQESKASLKAGR